MVKSISELFKKKELTIKEEKERKYRLELKKIENKILKNPFKIIEIIEELENKIDEGVEIGLITEEDKLRHLKKLNKSINNISRFKNKLGR